MVCSKAQEQRCEKSDKHSVEENGNIKDFDPQGKWRKWRE